MLYFLITITSKKCFTVRWWYIDSQWLSAPRGQVELNHGCKINVTEPHINLILLPVCIMWRNTWFLVYVTLKTHSDIHYSQIAWFLKHLVYGSYTTNNPEF